MEIDKIKQDAFLCFSLLGIFFLVGQLFMSLFGVAYLVSGEEIPLIIFVGLLLPLSCFIIAYGFKKSYLWAWYSALLLSIFIFVVGLSKLVQLSLAGFVPTLIAFFIFSWLFKVRLCYTNQNS